MSPLRSSTLLVALLPVLLLAGCDQQNAQPFSVEVRAETQAGTPVQNASVGGRPCYELGGETTCGSDAVFSGLRRGKPSKRTSSVELTAWTAERDGNAALLQWTTASETNNDRFVVERKTGNGSFTEIGDVEGAGTTERSTDYSVREARRRGAAPGRNAGRLDRSVRRDDPEGATDLPAVDHGGKKHGYAPGLALSCRGLFPIVPHARS